MPTPGTASPRSHSKRNNAHPKEASQIFAQRSQFASVTFDHVRITLVRPPSEVVKDTTIAFTPDSPPVTLDLIVDVATPGEIFTATLDYVNTGSVVFHGTGDVASHSGDQGSTPQEVVVQYVGVGATATKLVVSPKAPAIVAPGAVNFTVVALDASNVAVGGALVSWASSDPTVATINAATGVLTATGKRGSTTVTASAPTAIGRRDK
ncbi:MAG: Ig-like domain-containing protein [Gemmatimonadaceae bacterium]